MQTLNWVDLLLGVVVLFGIWTGTRRGFVHATLFLLTLLASLVLAFMFYRYPAEWLQPHLAAYAVWLPPASFLVVFLVAQVVLDSLAQSIVRGVPRRAQAHPVNTALGALPGFVNGLIHAAILALLALNAPLPEFVSKPARESKVAEMLSQPIDWIDARISPIFDPAIQRTMKALTVPVDSRGSVPLPFKNTQARVRTDLEARMLEMLNDERAKQGLKPVKADPELAEVARAHSRDMLARGYFSHVSPDGGTLTDRMRKGEVKFLVAGENLALAPTLNGAHQGLMNSPGHRANILRPQFGRVGIGVLDSGTHGLMVTQNFRN